jgi:hypothetical protein
MPSIIQVPHRIHFDANNEIQSNIHREAAAALSSHMTTQNEVKYGPWQVRKLYEKSFFVLRRVPKPRTMELEEEFTKVLENLMNSVKKEKIAMRSRNSNMLHTSSNAHPC